MAVTVAAAMDRAARECSITPPSAWISATKLAHVELRDDFLPETTDELLDRVDWPNPIGKTQTISGDGSTNYSLNSDFLRLQRDPSAVYESTTTRRNCIPVSTDGQWQYLNDIGTAAGERYYRLKGYEGARTIDFYRALATGDSVDVSYTSELWMQTSGGTPGSAWTDEADVLLLPRRLIELGVVWRFRKRKGLEYAAGLAEYEARLSRYANDRRSRDIIDMSGSPRTVAPWDIPVPDFIPSS